MFISQMRWEFFQLRKIPFQCWTMLVILQKPSFLTNVVFLAVAPPLLCVVFVGNRVAKFKNGRVQQKRLHDLVLHDGDFVWRDANGRHGVFIVDGNLHGIVSR